MSCVRGIDYGHRERRVLVGVSLLTKRPVAPVKIPRISPVSHVPVTMPFVSSASPFAPLGTFKIGRGVSREA